MTLRASFLRLSFFGPNSGSLVVEALLFLINLKFSLSKLRIVIFQQTIVSLLSVMQLD